MADTLGQADIRGENIDKIVTGFALQSFKLKQVCMLQNSTNWKESFFQETASELTVTDSGTGFSVKGVPRLAGFPNLNPSWTKASSYHIKHAGEATISLEDVKTSEFDVMARTLLRVGRAIAFSVDNAIYDVITADASTNTVAAADTWDSATVANRDPVGDILTAIKLCSIDNYDVLENGYLLVAPLAFSNLMRNASVIKHPTFVSGIMQNGRRGNLLGLTILESNSIDADEACVMKGQEAVTYKTAEALTTRTIEEPGIKWTIRAWEIGITMVKNPEAICIITNTDL